MSDMEAIPRDEFFESLLGDFLDESGQLLERLNENLLQLDEWVHSLDEGASQRCDETLMNEMFRSAHSLKGLSAMLSLTEINTLTHKVENVFDAARKDELSINGDVVELMFQAVDRLSGLVDALKEPSPSPVETESVVQGIQNILEAAGCAREKSSQADAERELANLTSEAEAAKPAEVTPQSVTSFAPAEVAVAAPEVETQSAAQVVSEPVSEEVPEVVEEPSVVDTIAEVETPPQEPEIETPVAESVTETVESFGETVKEAVEEEVVPTPVVPQVDVFANIVDEADLHSKYLSIFIDEAELSLDQLTETLLACENGGDRGTIERMLIVSHRIKGSAASIGLNRAAKLAHLMEDLLQEMMAKHFEKISSKIVDAMLGCSDALRQYVHGLRVGKPLTTNFNSMAQNLLLSQSSVGLGAAIPVAEETSQELVQEKVSAVSDKLLQAVVDRMSEGKMDRGLVGVVTFREDVPLVGLKGRLIYEKLSNMGDVVYFSPSPDEVEEMDNLTAVEFGFSTDKPLDFATRQLRIAGVDQVILEPMSKPGVVPAPGPQVAAKSAETAPPKSVSPQPISQPTAKPAPTPAVAQTPAPAQPVKAAAPAPVVKPSAPPARPVAAAAKPAAPAQAPAAASTQSGESKPTETLRVDIERLDQLMNLAGQLVINKARFAQIGDRLKKTISAAPAHQVLANVGSVLERMVQADASSDPKALALELETVRSQARRTQHDLEMIRRDLDSLTHVRASINDLFETIHQLDRVADGIQQSVMDTRMLPIGPLFQRFKRVIRDITRGNGKNIRLDVNGEKTELDKRMIDELGDPLIHMVRNSADHGVEPPEVRLAAGKPEQGVVKLDAFHRGNSIVIQVSDDGKGLDVERIRSKAIEKGLLTPADADRMTKQQMFQMIWEPGLSTAEKVTDISGRGMGMDIVKSKIEELNGTIELDSEMGKGTTITIKLPLTLAILPSLLVEIDRDTFAMPLESVVEIVSVTKKDMASIHGVWTARVRGRVISVVRLDEVFSWRVRRDCEGSENEDKTLVVIGESGRELGLVVNRVIGEEDIVIKSIAENYQNIEGVAGASILGDGRVSLILDLAALIQMASHQKVEA